MDQGCETVGRVALRQVTADICVTKRLYVRLQARGDRPGCMLMDRLIA